MEENRLQNVMFETSAGLSGGYPAAMGMEIAFAGRSNVGKSSLINEIARNRKLARTSQTPGKTRLINFYRAMKGRLTLVDLPGYGFARVQKAEQRGWGEMIERYLQSGRASHVFFLLDIRHAPTAEDRQMFRWLLYYGLPFTLIATKADQLPKTKRAQSLSALCKALGAPQGGIPFSARETVGRAEVIERILALINDFEALHRSPIDTAPTGEHNNA